MKRDMDLVRKILLVLSEQGEGHKIFWEEELPEWTAAQILHHAHLMSQGGLIEVADVSTMDTRLPQALPVSITWAGHEFIDAVRDPSLWEKAKTTVLKPAGGVAITVLLDWAKAEATRRIGLS